MGRFHSLGRRARVEDNAPTIPSFRLLTKFAKMSAIEPQLLKQSVAAMPQTMAPPPSGAGQQQSLPQQSPFRLTKDSTLQEYLEANRMAARALNESNPEVIKRSGQGQQPHTLWIGCSDSRVNECTALGCMPGEVFTLRNIANVINTSDLSAQSALQFAIEVLKVKKVIVCGHTDCGGVWASLSNKKTGGVLDHWLAPVRGVRAENLAELKEIEDVHDKCKRLSELNVINSVNIIKKNPSFVDAHAAGEIEIHGLIYDVATGIMHELDTEGLGSHHKEVFHLNGDGEGHQH